MSPEQAKGLEFDAAVVVDPGQIAALPGRGLRLLYIALTRTTRYLDVVYPEGTLPVQARRGYTPTIAGRL
ncbi:ATP-binding domain-containing protein [Salana multivorans]